MFDTIRDFLSQLQNHEWLVLIVFGVIFMTRLLYLIFTGEILFVRNNVKGEPQALSFILTFRNEEQNLRKNLPAVLNIDEDNFEVVAVDDLSTDNSMIVLGALKERYKRLRYSSLSQETWFSVKMAQNIALKAAKNRWVMVIPPSICEYSDSWISTVSSSVTEKSDVVVNYSNVKHDGTFYNLLYRIEFFSQQFRSFGLILNGFPYIVSEDNIAFRKDRYFLSGGYREKVKESYANLELIVNSFIKKKNVSLVLSPKTIILRNEVISRINFYDLLKKEIQIRKYLPFSRRIIITLEEYTGCLFLPVAVISFIFLPELWVLLLAILGLTAILKMFIIKKALSRLKEHKLFLTSLIYGVFFSCYKLFFRFYYNYYRRRKKWKSKR
jgi:glycosyltransferase involved in cell wall biosynthesis